MSNKIVQVTSQLVVGNIPTYNTKSVYLNIPKVVGNDTSKDVVITTNVDPLKIVGNLSGLGEEAIPNPSLFKRLDDYYHPIERITLTYRSIKSDRLSGVSDTFSRVVQYKRVFQESQVTNDSYKTFKVYKGLLDNPITNETIRKQLSKVFKDTTSNSERVSIVYGKSLLDSIVCTEELLKVAYKKAANELVVTQDILTTITSFNRLFTDYVDATDDFYGSANIDDDQVAYVGKAAIDWLTSSDIKSVVLKIVKADVTTTADQKYLSLNKSLNDTYTKSDQIYLNTKKVFSDTSSLSDLYYTSVSKKTLDTGTTSDIRYSKASKVLLDIGTTQDVVQNASYKILADSYITSDSIIKQWSAYRTFTDSFNTSEITSFKVSPYITDSSISTDVISNRPNKVLQDNSFLSDAFSRIVQYNRTLTDYIDATDDFFGNANIDDDQVAYVGKSAIDWVSPTETRSVYASKILSDTFGRVDYVYNNTNKVLSDNTTNYEKQYSNVGKSLTDIAINQELVSKYFFTPAVDSYTARDYFSRVVNYIRQYTDTVNKSDTVYIKPTKTLSDNISSSDYIYTTTNFKRTISDSTTNSEQLVRNIKSVFIDTVHEIEAISFKSTTYYNDTFNKSDTAYKKPMKVAADSVATSESVSFFKFSNRYFDDVATTTDVGTINNQSYFAGKYVEPGYVGTNTYFS